MTRLIRCLVVMAILLNAGWCRSAAMADAKGIRIVCFGDSTTAKRGKLKIYAGILQERLNAAGRATEVVNAGIGGSNTQDAVRRLRKDVLDRKPDIVVIQFGINDSAIDVWKKPPAEKPRVSIERFESNLAQIVDEIRQTGAKCILMTPNPLAWTAPLRDLYGKAPYDPADPDGFNLTLRTYSERVRRLAQREKIPLVDVERAFRQRAAISEHGIDDLLLDGMHPNEQGHRIVAELLLIELMQEPGNKR